MIISNDYVYGLEESIVASGYPMLSKPLTEEEFDKEVDSVWVDLSDSKMPREIMLSNKHIKRAIKLAQTPSGSGHDNALKGIIVQFDCNAPQYFWQQLQRYHFIDFVSSMSKMHCITKFDNTMIADGTSYTAIKNMEYAVQDYIAGECDIDTALRNVPMGLTYTARMSTNYLQLKTIYKQRRHHRSIEWQAFCDWIEELPLAQELIIGNTFKNESHYTGEQKE